MPSIADELISNLNLEIIEDINTPSREERRKELPSEFSQGPLGTHLPKILDRDDNTVWLHQSLSLEHLAKQRNLVLATGTASGKSLVFQIHVLHRILSRPEARILVMYPLKALASDQLNRWRKILRQCGLQDNMVDKIEGGVPMQRREQILESARIVIATPDVIHAWFMRGVGSGLTRRFLDNLEIVVLDEAHVYESAFGSNVAYLLRRLASAKRRASQSEGHKPHLQFIAATATIADPAQHLNLLTGFDFEVVEEENNGAPHYERQILHANGAEYGALGESTVADIAKGILDLPQRRRFIVFIDSRQGVERAVQKIENENVLPYRSGYEIPDRERIETALHDGSLCGIISTSALELGIDISDMEIGVTLGVPRSRKTFRQRIGRIGRAQPGAFFVIAPPAAFTRLGITFEEYFNKPVEPSHLYLHNDFIQFTHARCLHEEMEVLGQKSTQLPAGVKWPEGFGEIVAMARPGASRPSRFDFIARVGMDAPHINYPIRQVGEVNLDIRKKGVDDGERIGTIAMNQAIREAYPGATYLHAGKSYPVYEWRTRTNERFIRVGGAKKLPITKPILKNVVNLDLNSEGIIEGRQLVNKTGLVAEAHVHVNESVLGYWLGSSQRFYRDLRAENPAMSRKQRDFRTTGVIVRIEEEWFSGKPQARVRESVANGLRDLLSNEFGIEPFDLDCTSTNIALMTELGPQRTTDAVVIYDAVFGSLRLTEPLYDTFSKYIELLERGTKLAGEDAFIDEFVTKRLCEWAKSLELAGESSMKPSSVDVPDGWVLAYRRGSVISMSSNGMLVEREIIKPVQLPINGNKTILYQYKIPQQGEGYIPHAQVQATGQEWGWELWNPETDEFRDLDEESDV